MFPDSSYLNSEGYGWESDTKNNSYEAVLADQLPAPKHIVVRNYVFANVKRDVTLYNVAAKITRIRWRFKRMRDEYPP